MHYVTRIVVWDINWHFIVRICTTNSQIIISDDTELCVARVSQCEFNDHQLAVVNNLSLLISVRGGDLGYEPGNLPCTPPQKKNCRGWVHFFRIGV